MAAQIRISTVGVPSERNTGIPLSVVSSADPAPPTVPTLNFSTPSMTSNNMPKGRAVQVAKLGREKVPNPNNGRDLGLGAVRGPASADPPQDPRAAGAPTKVGGWVFKDKPGLE